MKHPHSRIAEILSCSLFILFFALMNATAENQYFVASTGGDSNDGSQARPWKTIQHGLNSATLGGGGATITVACGTYNENVSTTRSGSSSQPITLISANPDTYCAKIVSQGADSAVHFGSGSVAHGGNYITIKGFEVIGPNSNQGIAIQGNHTQVLHNKVHDIQRNGTCPDGGGAGVEIKWNGELYAGGPTDPAAINFDTVDSNIIYNIGSFPTLCNYTHGIYPSAPYNTISNNIVFNVAGYGIETYHYVTNMTIVNNTVFHNNESGIFISAKDLDDDHNIVANNIVVNNNLANSSGGIRATAFSPSGHVEGSHNVFSNNLTFGNVGGNYNLQNGSATNQLTSGTTATVFVNYTGDTTGDYHLKLASPAVGAGTTLGAPPTDFDSLPRLLDASVDVGAFEFATGSSPTQPSAPTGLTAQVQ